MRCNDTITRDRRFLRSDADTSFQGYEALFEIRIFGSEGCAFDVELCSSRASQPIDPEI